MSSPRVSPTPSRAPARRAGGRRVDSPRRRSPVRNGRKSSVSSTVGDKRGGDGSIATPSSEIYIETSGAFEPEGFAAKPVRVPVREPLKGSPKMSRGHPVAHNIQQPRKNS